MEREVLSGGVANAGLVVREGDEVVRPASPHAAAIHGFLGAVRSTGFAGVPEPIALGPSKERLSFVAGDVPMPPYSGWVQTDTTLASIARLLRSFHHAAASLPPPKGEWCTELADPAGGRVVCHNDVCLENVVFRNGEAVALIDFDYAAPGRPIFDLTALARMCVPIDDPVNAARLGWVDIDPVARLRLVADTYGATAGERLLMVELLDATFARGSAWVRGKIAAGHEGFAEMFAAIGGQERFDRRDVWWAATRRDVLDAMS